MKKTFIKKKIRQECDGINLLRSEHSVQGVETPADERRQGPAECPQPVE